MAKVGTGVDARIMIQPCKATRATVTPTPSGESLHSADVRAE